MEIKIPPRPAKQKRITFAAAIHDAHDTEAHPWIYATAETDLGHGLLVAHCVADCPDPSTCTCEEQTHLTWETLSTLYLQAVEAEALCCGRDIEKWCADDADIMLQAALYGGVVFQ